ncbi:MAG: hypothetical protein OXC28_26925 [Defluviicoccus sp.]|nr:hypothetical protein [Defluviicoccus sp.]
MSSSDDGRAPDLGALDTATETALAIAEKALDDGATGAIPDEMVQRLLTAGTRLFANKVEMEDRVFRPFVAPESATATDVVVTVTEMLHAANLNTFDLAMWFRRPRPGADD